MKTIYAILTRFNQDEMTRREAEAELAKVNPKTLAKVLLGGGSRELHEFLVNFLRSA